MCIHMNIFALYTRKYERIEGQWQQQYNAEKPYGFAYAYASPSFCFISTHAI